jgi:hypothetical protein
MKLLLVIALVGACTSPPHHSLEACEAAFDPAIVKACTVDTDCDLLTHPSCCGATMLGVSRANLDEEDPAEADFDACAASVCGATLCASATVSEDGMLADPNKGQMIVPVCVAGQCSSTVR